MTQKEKKHAPCRISELIRPFKNRRIDQIGVRSTIRANSTEAPRKQDHVTNQILSASPSEASEPTNSVSEQLATLKQKEHLLIIPTEEGDGQIWGK